MDLMINIETLDTKQSAIILEIGAVLFDPYKTISNKYFSHQCNISQQNITRTISYDTLEYFKKNGKTYESIVDQYQNASSLFVILNIFANFCTKHSFSHVWAKSPTFDLTILEHAFLAENIQTPWTYKQHRDVRTLLSIVPKTCYVPSSSLFNALDITRAQVKSVQNSFAYLTQLGVHNACRDY